MLSSLYTEAAVDESRRKQLQERCICYQRLCASVAMATHEQIQHDVLCGRNSRRSGVVTSCEGTIWAGGMSSAVMLHVIGWVHHAREPGLMEVKVS